MNQSFQKKSYFSYISAITVLVICSLSTMSVNAYVGKLFLGPDAVSVVNLVMSVSEIFYILLLLFGISAAIKATMKSTDSASVSRHFTVAFYMVLGCSVLLSLLLTLFSNPLTQFLSADSSLHDYIYAYMTMMLPFFVLHNILLLFQIFTLIVGKIREVVICSVVQFVVNIVCSMLLMNYLDWGIGSFSISSAVSVEVAAILLLIFHLRNGCPFVITPLSRTEFRSTLRFDAHYGLVFVATQLIYMLFAFTINKLVLGFLGETVMQSWSDIIFIFTIANYASLAGQVTCIFYGFKYLDNDEKPIFLRIFRNTYILVALWSLLSIVCGCIISYFEFYQSTSPLFIAISAPFIVLCNVMGVYSIRLLAHGKILSFIILYAAIYWSLPILLLLFHTLFPGHEPLFILAAIPILILEYYLSKRHLKYNDL